MPETLLFTNARVLDPDAGLSRDGLAVLVKDGRIAAVGSGIEAPSEARVLDLRGRTLMPGLIDCHVHVVAESLDLWSNMIAPSSLAGLRAARVMEMSCFAGMAEEEIAAAIGISVPTVARDMRFARAWLNRELAA